MEIINKYLFGKNGFKRKVVKSFRQVKKDIESFKNYAFEWFSIIINNQRILLDKVKELEQRVQELENDRRK